jgi:hypothetical protein
MKKYIPFLVEVYHQVLEPDQWAVLLTELRQRYGNKRALQNMQSRFRHGWIKDPDLPALNSSILLRAVWDKVKEKDDDSMYQHFGETLDTIGGTCIQGVSHRLFLDYVAIMEDEEEQRLYEEKNTTNNNPG